MLSKSWEHGTGSDKIFLESSFICSRGSAIFDERRFLHLAHTIATGVRVNGQNISCSRQRIFVVSGSEVIIGQRCAGIQLFRYAIVKRGAFAVSISCYVKISRVFRQSKSR